MVNGERRTSSNFFKLLKLLFMLSWDKIHANAIAFSKNVGLRPMLMVDGLRPNNNADNVGQRPCINSVGQRPTFARSEFASPNGAESLIHPLLIPPRWGLQLT